jgi:hypothetical protein
MLELDLLRAFVAVAECGSFRRAAERLHLTQSTVSQQIKRDGLPPLPDLEFAIFEKPGAGPAAGALAVTLAALAPSPGSP